MAKDASVKFAEQKLARFIEAQTIVFQNYDYLTEWCRESLAGQNDQASYDLAKRIFKDVVAFEGAFEDFEVEFWNYIGNIDDTRARVDHRVASQGLADHKEYFFKKIELSITRLGEIVTEVHAQGMQWEFLEDLETSLEGLYDISEDLIEADLQELGRDIIAELLGQIPPQRLAPLEVLATAERIRRKEDTHLRTRVHQTSIHDGAAALREVLSDSLEELERSNCDPRIKKAVSRCLGEISQQFEQFSPVKFGIYLDVANGFKDVLSEELSAFSARLVIAALLQCDIFLRNFQAWADYSAIEKDDMLGDASGTLETFNKAADDPLFGQDVRDALEGLAADKRDFGERGKIDYSIFQSISNAVSEACRQGLRYISAAPRSVSSLLGETARDGVKTAIGLLAVGWVLRFGAMLTDFAAKYPFFGWLKPVVDFIRTHAGG